MLRSVELFVHFLKPLHGLFYLMGPLWKVRQYQLLSINLNSRTEGSSWSVTNDLSC